MRISLFAAVRQKHAHIALRSLHPTQSDARKARTGESVSRLRGFLCERLLAGEAQCATGETLELAAGLCDRRNGRLLEGNLSRRRRRKGGRLRGEKGGCRIGVFVGLLGRQRLAPRPLFLLRRRSGVGSSGKGGVERGDLGEVVVMITRVVHVRQRRRCARLRVAAAG